MKLPSSIITLLFVALSNVLVFSAAVAAEPMLAFQSDEQAALYLQLTKDHRCLKCQNQNLADSGAGIADDLRREIYERVIAGESGDEISAYLVKSYGDFVLYRPPFKSTTYALWIGPFVLLMGALWYAYSLSRKSARSKNAAPAVDTSASESDNVALQRAKKLLDE